MAFESGIVLLVTLLCVNPTEMAVSPRAIECAVPVVTSPEDSARVWLGGGGLGRVFSGGKWSTVDREPAAGSPTKSSGADKHGPYTTTSCDWPRGATPSEPALKTTVTVYAELGATVYAVVFPEGAKQTNVSVPGGPEEQRTQSGKINTDGIGPFVEFPLFDVSKGIVGNASWMTWNQGLQYHDTSSGAVREHVNNITGLARGPLVLFDESNASAHTPFPVAVVSQLNHIRVGAALVRPSGCSAQDPKNPCRMSYGPSWELTEVRFGFDFWY